MSDYLADVQRYEAGADAGTVDKIVKAFGHCVAQQRCFFGILFRQQRA